jgi:hypothetical protein
MPKGTSRSTAVIERLLEERRRYEAWIARLNSAADATPVGVRTRVLADYEARLAAVIEELRAHAASAQQAMEQRRHMRDELQKKEAQVSEKLTETELRHAVGEYDEAQWTQVHKDILAELVTVREELGAIEADIARLEELDELVRSRPGRVGPPPKSAPARVEPRAAPTHVDELAFIKSVTEDEKGGPSARRAAGAEFQPAIPADAARSPVPAPAPARLATPAPAPIMPTPREGDLDEQTAKTLRCKECGTMNRATEWYCEQCGAELAAV